MARYEKALTGTDTAPASPNRTDCWWRRHSRVRYVPGCAGIQPGAPTKSSVILAAPPRAQDAVRPIDASSDQDGRSRHILAHRNDPLPLQAHGLFPTTKMHG